MASLITPVFRSGDSQVVRIPHEFSFEADKVEISRNADGDLIIRQLPVDPGAVLVEALSAYAGGRGAEFAAAMDHDEAPVPAANDSRVRR